MPSPPGKILMDIWYFEIIAVSYSIGTLIEQPG